MSLSLFASTAFAGSAATSQPVVVTNTPVQPVPMVGLVMHADNPARQPFQWSESFGPGPGIAQKFFTVMTLMGVTDW
jgi:hypothetical protein